MHRRYQPLSGDRRGGTIRLLTMWRRGVQPPPAHHLPTVPSGLVRRSTPPRRDPETASVLLPSASARSAHRKVGPTLRIPDTLNTRQHEEESHEGGHASRHTQCPDGRR